VRHAYDVEDAEAGLRLGFGAAAVIEILFVGVEVLGGGVGSEVAGVGREVKVLAQEGVVGGREVGALSGEDGFREEGGLKQSGDIGQWEIIGGSEIVGAMDDTGADLVGVASKNRT
jgi:hypothetical protein